MSTTLVILYTSGPGCMACKQTKRHLERRGIPYEEVSIVGDEQVLAAIKELGFSQAPVVCVAQSWDGYRPDRIDALGDPP